MSSLGFDFFRLMSNGSGVSDRSEASVNGSSCIPESQPSIRLPNTLGAELGCFGTVAGIFESFGVDFEEFRVRNGRGMSKSSFAMFRLARQGGSGSSAWFLGDFLNDFSLSVDFLDVLSRGSDLGREGPDFGGVSSGVVMSVPVLGLSSEEPAVKLLPEALNALCMSFFDRLRRLM